MEPGLEPPQQRELVRALVEKVETHAAGGWVVIFRSPFRELLHPGGAGSRRAESFSA